MPRICPDSQPSYGHGEIEVLSSVAAIRRRPGLYLGGPLSRPDVFPRLIAECLCLAVESVCAGTCTEIAVTVGRDGATIRDNGSGLPMTPVQSERCLLEVLLTEVGACRARKQGQRSGAALCRLGLVVVNALSDPLRVRNFRDGVLWTQEYRCGEAQGPFRNAGPTTETGLEIAFRPDPSLFESLAFNPLALLGEVARLGLGHTTAEVRRGDETTVVRLRGLSVLEE